MSGLFTKMGFWVYGSVHSYIFNTGAGILMNNYNMSSIYFGVFSGGSQLWTGNLPKRARVLQNKFTIDVGQDKKTSVLVLNPSIYSSVTCILF